MFLVVRRGALTSLAEAGEMAGADRRALQAMATALDPPPDHHAPAPGAVAYLLNPKLEMSSGNALAQIAHAAVMAAERAPEWADAGCPARVVDAGLTEVRPGTVTVLAR